MASVLGFCHSADAPTERISSTSVSVSRMRGTLSSVTGCSVRSAAAMIGSAAFLLPDGSIVPASRWPPSMVYWIGGTRVLQTYSSFPATPDHAPRSTNIRPRQPEMGSQGVAIIGLTEQAALAQERHDFRDE